MRQILFLLLFPPLVSFSQKNTKSAALPKNCIQLDSTTFIGQTEITNATYRSFVNFVQDSIITHLLYDSLPSDQALRFLVVSQRELKNVLPENRAENFKKYSLNYNAYKNMSDDSLVQAILNRNIYYQYSSRFYRRREIDSRKLIYRYDDKLVAVYPDTNSWNTDYYVKYKHLLDTTQFIAYPTDSYVDMYFWYPTFDNYPVVGLNLQQIRAFCHWYECEMNKQKGDPLIQYHVTIPTEDQYIQALQLCYPKYLGDAIHPDFAQNLVTYERDFTDAVPYIHPVYQAVQFYDKNELANYKAQTWTNSNSTSPILNLLGGPAEVCSDSKSPGEVTVLGGDYYLGIVDKNEVQPNTLFYKRNLPANQGYSYVGFRIVVSTTTKFY